MYMCMYMDHISMARSWQIVDVFKDVGLFFKLKSGIWVFWFFFKEV